MSEQDLMAWLLENYFGVIPWALRHSEAIREEDGLPAAVSHLRKICVDGSHGASGPGKPRYQTRSGVVLVWSSGGNWDIEPELTVDLTKLCSWKLEKVSQSRMF